MKLTQEQKRDVVARLVVAVLLTGGVVGCALLTGRPASRPPPAPAITAEARALLAQVEVTYEVQRQFDAQGRQKAVIWVTNRTARVLESADLRVTLVTWDGTQGGQRLFQRTAEEVFTLTQLRPGLRTWGILWFHPQRSRSVTYAWQRASFAP